ncbi:MAG: hypothetical protein ACR2K1_03175 [Saprospiraceae bacterium]
MLFWGFLLLPMAGRGQPTATFDRATAETGEAFRLQIRTAQRPARVDLSAWSPWFPEENILHRSAWKAEAGAWYQEITLICFDAGAPPLPPAALLLATGDTLPLPAPPLLVEATPAPEDLADMADIKEIIREPAHWTDYLFWLYWLVAAALLLVAARLLSRLLHRRRAMRARSLQAPPGDLARRRLERLEQQQLWQKGAYAAYYAELSHILREFLELRYGILALESVTAQILAHLAQTDFPKEALPEIEHFLRQAELAKFAKAVPAAGFHEQAFRLVFEISKT